MDLALIITIAVMAIGLGLGLAMATRDLKDINSFTRRLTEETGSEPTRNGGKGVFAGRPYLFEYLLRTRNSTGVGSSSILRLLVRADIPHDIKITNKTSVDKFTESIQLSKEFKTGEDNFDQRYFILSNDNTFATQQLMDNSQREHINALFQQGIKEVYYCASEKVLSVDWERFNYNFDSKKIITCLEHLTELCKQLPIVNTDLDKINSDRHYSKAFMYLMLFCATLLGMGGFAAIIVDNSYTPFDRTALFQYAMIHCLPLFIVFIILSKRLLSSHIDGYKHWLGIIFMATFGFPVTAYAMAVGINGAMDTSGKTEKYKIIDKYKVSRDGTFDHFLKVKNKTKNEIEIPISYYLFHEINEKTKRVRVTTHDGKLGFQWRNNNDIKLINKK